MPDFSRIRRGLVRGAENPRLFLQEANRHIYRRGNDHNTAGVRVMEKDWDMLVILDACRLDQFEDLSTIEGSLTSISSRGSHTREWLRGNFADQEFYDTVYATASPQQFRWSDHLNADFHHIENIWQHHTTSPPGVVLPDDMAREVSRLVEEYPNKRILAHFMQPHYPFVEEQYRHLNADTEDDPDIWNRLRRGDLDASPETIGNALRANLRLAMPHVRELIDDFDGKVVVSADHGNLLGERVGTIPYTEWGHPPGIYATNLVNVPWLEVESETRRQVTWEPPTADVDEIADEAVEERLQDLGYV